MGVGCIGNNLLRFYLRRQADGYSIFLYGTLRFAREDPFFATGEEWLEGVDVLFSIESGFYGEDMGVVRLNGVNDLEDAALRLDLRINIC